MNIYELFLWLHDAPESIHLSNNPINLETFSKAYELAKKTHHALLNEFRALRYGVERKEEQEVELQTKISTQEKYIQFLQQCSPLITHETDVFFVFLNVLSGKSIQEQEHFTPHIILLFNKLSKEKQKQVLQKKLFHEELQNTLYFEYKLGKTKFFLSQMDELLVEQKENACGLITLGEHFLHSITHTAALVIWLLDNQCTETQILESHLLQHLALNYLPIDQEYKIKLFYKILEQFPQAQELLQRSETICCDERAYAKRSLRGDLISKDLIHLPFQIEPLAFVPTEENFKQLYFLFGQKFLLSFFESDILKAEDENLFLKKMFNQEECISNLGFVINSIAKSPQKLARMASLLEDQTLQLLLTNKEYAVFHLISLKSNFFKEIDIQLEDYLPFFQEKAAEEVVPQLISLINFLKEKKEVNLLYEEIIKHIIKSPTIMQDELLRPVLKNKTFQALLRIKCENIQINLHSKIDTLLGTPLNEIVCQELKVEWEEAHRQINALNYFLFEKYTFENKFEFQAKIADLFFAKYGTLLDLELINKVFSPRDEEIIPNETSAKEHFYIEILVLTQQPELRKAVINFLEMPPMQAHNWRNKAYCNGKVFFKASFHGNLELLKLLGEKYSSDLVYKSALKAVERHHWPVVTYLFSTFKHSSFNIKPILTEATSQGISNFVFQHYSQLKKSEQVFANKLFQIALQKERPEIASFILGSHCPPAQHVLKKIFNDSPLETRVKVVSGLGKTPAEIQLAQEVLIIACEQKKLSVVQEITQKFSTEMDLEKAFTAVLTPTATPCDLSEKDYELEIIKHLCQFSRVLNQDTIHGFFKQSLEYNKVSLVRYFSENHLHLLNINKTIVETLIEKNLEGLLIALFDRTVSAPTASDVKTAYLKAISLHNERIITYLHANKAGFLDKDLLEEGLLKAINSKQSKLAETLFKFNEPSSKTWDKAIKRCKATGQTPLGDFLKAAKEAKLQPKTRRYTLFESITLPRSRSMSSTSVSIRR